MLESDRDGVPGRAASAATSARSTGAPTCSGPAYDLYGQLWVVDRTRAGARLSVVRAGTARTVDAPGVTGAEVAAFELSRDGTRLVTQVRRGGRDRVLVSRVERDAKGRVTRVGARAAAATSAARRGPVRDIAWRTPAAWRCWCGRRRPPRRSLLVKVDGSSTRHAWSTDAELFERRATRLVASPAPGTPLLAGTADGRLLALSPDRPVAPDRDRARAAVRPTFVG